MLFFFKRKFSSYFVFWFGLKIIRSDCNIKLNPKIYCDRIQNMKTDRFEEETFQKIGSLNFITAQLLILKVIMYNSFKDLKGSLSVYYTDIILFSYSFFYSCIEGAFFNALHFSNYNFFFYNFETSSKLYL